MMFLAMTLACFVVVAMIRTSRVIGPERGLRSRSMSFSISASVVPLPETSIMSSTLRRS